MRKLFPLCGIIFLLLSAVLSSQAKAALANTDFPMFQHDEQHTGISPFLGPQSNPMEKWHYPTGANVVYSTPIIGTNGVVYIGGNNSHKVYAINPGGSLKWDYLTGDDVFGSAAVSDNGYVYIGSTSGKLHALNESTGLEKPGWNFSLPNSSIYSSPVIGADGTIYVGASQLSGTTFTDPDSFRLYAINPADGSTKWSFGSAADTWGIWSSPALSPDGNAVYFGSQGGKFYALNTSDGSVIGSYGDAATTSGIDSSPSVFDQGGGIYDVFFGSNNGKVFGLTHDSNLGTLTEKWVRDLGDVDKVFSSPAVGPDGRVYVGAANIPNPGLYDGLMTDEKKLFSLDGTTGAILWAYETGAGGNSMIESSPTLDANGLLYFGAYDGYVYALDTDPTIINPANRLAWKYFINENLCWSSPTIAEDGTLYIGTQAGNLYALVPEPSTFLLFGTAISGLIATYYRKRK